MKFFVYEIFWLIMFVWFKPYGKSNGERVCFKWRAIKNVSRDFSALDWISNSLFNDLNLKKFIIRHTTYFFYYFLTIKCISLPKSRKRRGKILYLWCCRNFEKKNHFFFSLPQTCNIQHDRANESRK